MNNFSQGPTNPSHSDSNLPVYCSLSSLCPKNFYPVGGCRSHRMYRGVHAPRDNFQPRREESVLLTVRQAILRCTLCLLASSSQWQLIFMEVSCHCPQQEPQLTLILTFFFFFLFRFVKAKCVGDICLILSSSINIYSTKCSAKG